MMKKLTPAAAVLLGIVTVFFVVLSIAWFVPADTPKLTNADYFERVGWIVGLIVALFIDAKKN